MALRRISYASSSVKLLRPLSNGSSLYYMVHKYFFPEKLLITEAVDIQFVNCCFCCCSRLCLIKQLAIERIRALRLVINLIRIPIGLHFLGSLFFLWVFNARIKSFNVASDYLVNSGLSSWMRHLNKSIRRLPTLLSLRKLGNGRFVILLCL